MEVLAIYARTSVDKSENSTIDQQIKAGIEFANNNSMKHKIFQDRGISGYKIEEDEEKNPFDNRPAFSEMIDDIKAGKINAIWVWEHSRISRNQYASAYIFNIFSKYKIRLYVKDKLYDLDDPNVQLLRSMLDAVAQYERQLIVKRTTRGLYNAIDKGNRSYPSLFGYRKTIKNKNGNYIWEPIESELLQVADWFSRYKNGESLKNIVFSQNSNENKTSHILKRTSHLSRTLQHYVYTGYSLNTKGLDYLKKFDNFEIDSLQVLRNPDYWIKSIPYPKQIFTIEEWIEVKERLRIYKEKHKKNAHRRAEKSIGTGIITCRYCGAKYFYQVQAHKRKHGLVLYPYYFHMAYLDRHCTQSPKSVSQEKIDTILKIFVLYSTITSDSGTKFLKERLFQDNIEEKAIKEKLKVLKNNRREVETQIDKFRTALLVVDNVEDIIILTKQIDKKEKSLNEIDNNIVNVEVELAEKQEAMGKTKSQLMHYSISGLLKQFFEKWNIGEQRNHLLKVIDSAVITGTQLEIKSGEYTYIFDINKKYVFPESIYNEMLNEAKEDIDYFSNFKNKGDTQFNNSMWGILAESELKGICEHKEAEKQLIF